MIRQILIIGIVFYFIITGLPLLSQVNFTSSNLPIVKIQTNGQEIPEDEKITVDMTIIYHGQGEINHVNDTVFDYDGIIGIEKRGNSSLTFPKNSYSIETRDSSGNNLNVSIVDLPEENDWILYAPYSDKSLMRNVLTYEVYRRMGWYAPRTGFCEVLLNDEYIGVYVLLEKIKRDENRVDISKLTSNDTVGDELTGGYILRVDRHEGSGWTSLVNGLIYFQHMYPGDDILPVQMDYIQNHINSFEEFLISADSSISDTISNALNVECFIDYIIMNEVAKNADAYRLSTYIYKDKDSQDPRIYVGPVWDYNLGYGNYEDFNAYETSDYFYNDTTFFTHSLFWFRKLMGMDFFHDQMKNRWDTLRASLLNEETLFSIIDSAALMLDEAQVRNFQKWDILGQYVWPNYYIGETYDEEVLILKEWLSGRLSWMNDDINSNSSHPGNGTAKEQQILIFPLPFDDHINIQFLNEAPGKFDFYLYNTQGVIVFKTRIDNIIINSSRIKIDLANQQLKKGIYLFKCISDDKIVGNGKLVKF